MTDKERVLKIISDWGGIDGGHHKQWLLDQIVRELTDSDIEYQIWVDKWEDGEDGPRTYIWDEGIAP